MIKQKHELERQEELTKLQEQSAKKQLDAQIKGASEGIKGLEKEIGELEKMKFDVSKPTLAGKDERMTSLARGSGDLQHQQLKMAERHVKLAELQQRLMAEIARYQKLIAEKEENVFVLGS